MVYHGLRATCFHGRIVTQGVLSAPTIVYLVIEYGRTKDEVKPGHKILIIYCIQNLFMMI